MPIEKGLREPEAFYRELLKTSPEAIIISDTDGKILDVSQWLLKIHGFDRIEELIGKSLLDLIPSTDIEKGKGYLREILEKGHLRNIEITLLKRDNTPFIAEMNASLLRD